MKGYMSDRAVVQIFVISHGTVRSVGKDVGLSKSCIHKKIRRFIDATHKTAQEKRLAKEAYDLICENTRLRTLRGGMATKKGYQNPEIRKKYVEKIKASKSKK